MDAGSIGDPVCLGTEKGHLMMMRASDQFELTPFADITLSKTRISKLSLSPDSRTIAAVSGSTVFLLREKENEEGQMIWKIDGIIKVRLVILVVLIFSDVFTILVK